MKLSPAAATLAFACVLLTAAPARALEVVVKDLRAPAANVVATVVLRDPLPDRFKKTVDDGGALHLRVQAELWESRPVWDRLVYPAVVRVFRFARAASGREVAITDSSNGTSMRPAVPDPMELVLDLGKTDRVNASAKYYVHVLATLGTIAEREADDVGDAVFGRESESTGLGSLGRMVFRTVIKVSDYLQSVSSEATGRKLAGADILKRVP
jgi:hypothetical protein